MNGYEFQYEGTINFLIGLQMLSNIRKSILRDVFCKVGINGGLR